MLVLYYRNQCIISDEKQEKETYFPLLHIRKKYHDPISFL